MRITKVPTLCFKHKGRVFSVTKVCEASNTVTASLTKGGRRLQGRPKRFDLRKIGPLNVRGIVRSTR